MGRGSGRDAGRAGVWSKPVIVVNSSVWIANLRGIDNVAVLKLRELANTTNDQILVGDLILLEVLQGARDDANAARIEQDPRRYPIARMVDESLVVRAAHYYRRLRTQRITVRKTIDMIIGTFCIEGGHRLLHDDRDFDPMARLLGLEVI
jgi:predicted nucleic acid-binding protein